MRDRVNYKAALLLAALAGGCSWLRSSPKIQEPVKLIAVLPIQRAEPVGAPASGRTAPVEPPSPRPPQDAQPFAPDAERPAPDSARASQEGPSLAPGAERVVTAQIYEVLSSDSRWRFVPDLTASQAVVKTSATDDLAARARAFGRSVGADAVLFGTVSRYSERVGAEYGAKQPAAVAFSLQLVSVPSGAILWKGAFDQKQQPLSSNLFNWWQFWKGGPKWFTAQEFTRIAVERLLEDLGQQVAA